MAERRQRARRRPAGRAGPAKAGFFDRIAPHLDRLYAVAADEIAFHVTTGSLYAGEVSPEDVVDAVVLGAYERAARRPEDVPLELWLLRLAIEHVALEAARRADDREGALAVEDEVQELEAAARELVGPGELDALAPGEHLRVEDVVPDPTGADPEELASAHEMLGVPEAFAALPEPERRAFVLHHRAGLTVADVARVSARSAAEVRADLEHARASLERWIGDAGDDALMQRLFPAAMPAELPPERRTTLSEAIRRREKPGRHA